jgi:murein DD-endopeptidase MepM/ murein hydrolase activator NlpD
MKKLGSFFVLLISFMGYFNGCTSTNEISPTITPSSTNIPNTPTQIVTPSLTATDVPATPTSFFTSTPSPLLIVFPTEPSLPTLSWRPPLYAAPLALGLQDHFYFSRPIAVDQVNWPLADYRYGYIFPNTDIVHTGIDIEAPRGTPILAAASGIVVWAGHDLQQKAGTFEDPYGLAVAIRHNFGYEGKWLKTIYAHMDRIDVINGQVVEAGDQLGIVGNTGFTTGPHLHFEVRLESQFTFSSRNPELWLTPPEGDGVLVGRVMYTNGQLLYSKNVRIDSTDKKSWAVYTYGPQTINSDDFYKENFVLSNLPAGKYVITITFDTKVYTYVVDIFPGTTTAFSFQGRNGFSLLFPTNEPSKFWQTPEPYSP